MHGTRTIIAAFAILAGASACATRSTNPTTDYFRASFYREFPKPPMSLDERADMVEFWCVNRPADVAPHEICELEDGDV